MCKRLKDIPRFHVIRFVHEQGCNLYLLNEAHIAENGKVQFEWHRIYPDGRTSLMGKCSFDPVWVEKTEVVDCGEFYEWMKENHPVRYKREGWESSKT